jgi:cold shock CspA family protein
VAALRSAPGAVFWESDVATRYCEVVQRYKGLRFYSASKDVFVHISAVEKAGFTGLVEGAKISYEIVSDRGKESAGNLRV